MITRPDIDRIKKHFGKDVQDICVKSKNRVIVTIDPGQIVDISRFVFSELRYRFIIATALETSQGIEIFYHFSDDHSGLVLNLQVILDKVKPEIESLTGLFEAANWIEREMHEILGIKFLNHPNLEKLISEGNWAEGVYPYRKS